MKNAVTYILTAGLIFLSGGSFSKADDNTCSHQNSSLWMNSTNNINETEHNCSMWAAISNNFPDSLIYNQLLDEPFSSKFISQSYNFDGWGISYYSNFSDSSVIARGAVRAFNDSVYDSVVLAVNASEPEIILAHIRNCSSGCCCHGCDSIANPHPFERYKNNKYWSFEHKGDVEKPLLFELIGEEYLANNPLTGSGIPECDPSDSANIIDSELYFVYLLKNIEDNGWNVAAGLREALLELIYLSRYGAFNFILSDGNSIWAFRNGNTLFYLYDSTSNTKALATIYPSEIQGNWQDMSNFEMVILNADEAPSVISPEFIPGDINGDKVVIGSDITYSVRYFTNQGPPPPNSCYNDSTGSWIY